MTDDHFATVRCVVFDIDDTLYLERDYIRSGFHAVDSVVRERYGVSDFAVSAWAAFERGVRGTTFDVALRECGVEPTEDVVAELVRVYREHEPKISLLADAAECLGALEGRVSVAAVSDGPLASQQNKAMALGLVRWCDPVVLTASLGADRGKPHPAAFERIERATGQRGECCLYVADNPAKDFQGPKSLGWRTVRIRRPLGLHFSVEEPVCCDLEMADLGQLADLLDLGNRAK
jgi:putative hydrolase of the HAD superfamily